MHQRTAIISLAVCALLAPPAFAATNTYTGKATNPEGDFDYGKTTVKVSGNRIKRIEIQAVTTSGCGGFMTVVFAQGYEGSKIVKGSNRIRNGRFSFVYQPTTDVEDQFTRYKGRVTGSKVTGTFESGDLCANEGRFVARR